MRELENYQRAWAEKDPEEKAREKERALEAEKFGERYSRDAFANWQNGGMKKDCIYVNRPSLFQRTS